jgi:hypothetical protein
VTGHEHRMSDHERARTSRVRPPASSCPSCVAVDCFEMRSARSRRTCLARSPGRIMANAAPAASTSRTARAPALGAAFGTRDSATGTTTAINMRQHRADRACPEHAPKGGHWRSTAGPQNQRDSQVRALDHGHHPGSQAENAGSIPVIRSTRRPRPEVQLLRPGHRRS